MQAPALWLQLERHRGLRPGVRPVPGAVIDQAVDDLTPVRRLSSERRRSGGHDLNRDAMPSAAGRSGPFATAREQAPAIIQVPLLNSLSRRRPVCRCRCSRRYPRLSLRTPGRNLGCGHRGTKYAPPGSRHCRNRPHQEQRLLARRTRTFARRTIGSFQGVLEYRGTRLAPIASASTRPERRIRLVCWTFGMGRPGLEPGTYGL